MWTFLVYFCPMGGNPGPLFMLKSKRDLVSVYAPICSPASASIPPIEARVFKIKGAADHEAP